MRYLIRVSRHFYAGTIGAQRHTYIDSDCVPVVIKSWQYVRPFACRADAIAAIHALESEPYLMGNGECGSPTYTASPESKWPEYINA